MDVFSKKSVLDPYLTVVTVVFNDVKHIESTIKSCLELKLDKKEYIVIDGGSTDGTIEVINKYKEHIDVFISEKDEGIYYAMNKAVALAKGAWLFFLNSGDTLSKPDVLMNLCFEEIEGDIDFILGDIILTFPQGELLMNLAPQNNDVPDVFHQSMLIRTKALKGVYYCTEFRICADYNFFFNALKSGSRFSYVPIPFAKYDMSGFSATNLKLFCAEWQRIVGRTNRVESLKFTIKDIVRSIIPSIYDKVYFWYLLNIKNLKKCE